jgi:hypothetical protein
MIAWRGASTLAVLAAALITCGPSRAVGFGPTHMVSLKVRVSDHWTRTQDTGCGPVGTGSVNLTETWRRPARALPELDPSAGRWVLLVLSPDGHSALDLSAQRATGTISYANQLSIGGDTGCAGSVDTSGCRTYKLSATSNVFGIDRRSLRVLSTLAVGAQIRPRGSCLIGAYRSLNDINFFAHNLSIKMPSPAVLRSERRAVATGSNHAHMSIPFVESGFTVDETVTQTAVLTLTRIGR